MSVPSVSNFDSLFHKAIAKFKSIAYLMASYSRSKSKNWIQLYVWKVKAYVVLSNFKLMIMKDSFWGSAAKFYDRHFRLFSAFSGTWEYYHFYRTFRLPSGTFWGKEGDAVPGIFFHFTWLQNDFKALLTILPKYNVALEAISLAMIKSAGIAAVLLVNRARKKTTMSFNY